MKHVTIQGKRYQRVDDTSRMIREGDDYMGCSLCAFNHTNMCGDKQASCLKFDRQGYISESCYFVISPRFNTNTIVI
jgi:hypothetical protein